ncbi:MAG: hypothetical protein K8I03_12365 [Ignavibacteria bacterium]|nr:hypothetical protein [Ignavibacteria bacterium]
MRSITNLLMAILVVISIFIFGTNSVYTQQSNQTHTEEIKIIKPTVGFLKIENNWEWTKKDIFDTKQYLPYRIYNEKGELVKKVSGSKLGPVTVSLQEGIYYIKSRDKDSKSVEFGVEIEAGKTTLIE